MLQNGQLLLPTEDDESVADRIVPILPYVYVGCTRFNVRRSAATVMTAATSAAVVLGAPLTCTAALIAAVPAATIAADSSAAGSTSNAVGAGSAFATSYDDAIVERLSALAYV